MFIRFFMILCILSQAGCGRIYNTISNVRLECGKDAIFDKSYVKFIDRAGHTVPNEALEYRSLDGTNSNSLTLTSKGCLDAAASGLWLIRHKDKAEGLILDFSKIEYSSLMQMQDVSQENLKPQCPTYESGTKLDLREILNASSLNDKRAYEIRFVIRDEKEGILLDAPWINFSYLQSIPLKGSFPEGRKALEIETRNNFRSAEVSKNSCSIKFDYSAPDLQPNIQGLLLTSYKNRPFYAADSERDIRFRTTSDDLKVIEVCVSKLSDWDNGKIVDFDDSICTNPLLINIDQSVPLPERKGFWKLQFRGVDQAGNASSWSPPMTILSRQSLEIEKLKSRAVQIANVVDSKGPEGSTQAMMLTLELYQSWNALPTEYEKKLLENMIILSLHRPWFQDSLYQEIRTSQETLGQIFFALPLMKGKKILLLEGYVFNSSNRKLFAKILDMETFEVNVLQEIDDESIGIKKGGVSKDGTKFFWCGGDDSIYFGSINETGVVFDRLPVGQEIFSARFIDRDSKIAILTDTDVLTIDLEDEKRKLVAKPYLNQFNLVFPNTQLTDDGHGFYFEDYELSKIVRYSFGQSKTEGVEISIPNDVLPGFNINRDYVRFLEGEHTFLVKKVNVGKNSCDYTLVSKDANQQSNVQRIVKNAPCHLADSWTYVDDFLMIRDNYVRIGRVVKGVETFRRSIMDPPLRNGQIYAAQDRIIRDQGQWMFSGSYEFIDENQTGDFEGYLRIWKRLKDGRYQFLSRIQSCGVMPIKLQYAVSTKQIISACSEQGVPFLDLTESESGKKRRIPTESDIHSTALLNDSTLAAGLYDGSIHVYDLAPEIPIEKYTFNNSKTRINGLLVDKIYQRVFAINNGESKQIRYWDGMDLREPAKGLFGFQSGVDKLALSTASDFLAAIPDTKADMQIKVWDNTHLDKLPVVLDGHKSWIRDISFLGSSSVLVSGAFDGVVKLWDVSNPEISGVNIQATENGQVENLAGVPGANDFVVETTDSQMYQYSLKSIPEIVEKTCTFLTPYLADNPDVSADLRKLCRKVNISE